MKALKWDTDGTRVSLYDESGKLLMSYKMWELAELAAKDYSSDEEYTLEEL